MKITKREFALMVIPVLMFLVGAIINPLISNQFSITIGIIGYIGALALAFWLGELIMSTLGDED